MLATAAGVVLAIIAAPFFIWLVLRCQDAFSEGELRRHASIVLTALFVVTSLGFIVVSQIRHEFRLYETLECSDCPYDRQYSAWNSIKDTHHLDYWRWFVGVGGQKKTDAIKARIDAELHDKRTLAKSDPVTVAFVVLLAMLLSPELLILAVAGGWWARTAPAAMLCGLGAALVHDFLMMMLKFTEQFPSHTFPVALGASVALSLAAHLVASHSKKASVQSDGITQSDGHL
ncbi:MAG: hypothetical protein K2Z80_15705 [Xanthobacteraceae bacterium]|nr:hypothetical protein [Xanthobacteraceae bacterium]